MIRNNRELTIVDHRGCWINLGVLNSKHEIRNSKQYLKLKIPNQLKKCFENLELEFVSASSRDSASREDFDIMPKISKFSILLNFRASSLTGPWAKILSHFISAHASCREKILGRI